MKLFVYLLIKIISEIGFVVLMYESCLILIGVYFILEN